MTLWNAFGYELCKMVSVCRTCVDGCKPVVESKADAMEIDIEDRESDELYNQDDEDKVDRDDEDESERDRRLCSRFVFLSI